MDGVLDNLLIHYQFINLAILQFLFLNISFSLAFSIYLFSSTIVSHQFSFRESRSSWTVS
jgi:hypothetical protein